MTKRNFDSDQQTAKTGKKVKVNDNDENNFRENQVRRSGRDTKGRGGALHQLNNIGDAIRPDLSKNTQKPKNRLASILESEPVNPMAPIKPTRKKRAKNVNPLTSGPPRDTPAPLPMTHIVPQGTEPEINSSRFGFSAPDPLPSNPSPAIDPALQSPVPQPGSTSTGSSDKTLTAKPNDAHKETENSDDSDTESEIEYVGNIGRNGDYAGNGDGDGDGDGQRTVTDADARRQFGSDFDVSDSEQERQMLQNLGETIDYSDGQDLVAAYRQKNKVRPPPRPTKLAATRRDRDVIHDNDTGTGGNTGDELEDAEAEDAEAEDAEAEDDEAEDDEPDGTKRQSRQKRNESRLLRFYPSQWQDILESSKKKFRLWLATTNPWPVRDDALKEAKECLDEALIEHKEAGKLVEKGYLRIYQRDMIAHIADDVANWHSEMKKVARQIILGSYSIFPNMDGIAHNQQEFFDLTSRKVEDLLKKDKYLRDGVDAQGRTNNFTNPALRDMYIKGFFGCTTALGHIFPDEFGHEVPEPTLAFLGTCVKASLDEWILGYEEKVKFTRVRYRPAYVGLLGAVHKIKADKYHGAKLQRALQGWAILGTQLRKKQVESQGVEIDIVLD